VGAVVAAGGCPPSPSMLHAGSAARGGSWAVPAVVGVNLAFFPTCPFPVENLRAEEAASAGTSAPALAP